MDKLASFHYLNPSIFQNPLIHKPPRTHSQPTSLTFPVTSSKNGLPFGFPCSDKMSGVNKTLNSVKTMHAQMIKMSYKGSLDDIGKSLISHYLELRDFRSAIMVFFLGCSRNYVTWNNFLEEFSSFNGDPDEILKVFCELHFKGVAFDSKVLNMVLKICASLMNLWVGMKIHACLIKRGFDLDVYSKCALVNFYGSCWQVESANQVFDEMPERGRQSWNEIIMVHLKNEKWMEALESFRAMELSFVQANINTIAKILQACGKLGILKEGKQVHGYSFRYGLGSNLSICSSLITMYSRNYRLELARRVFDSMKDRNLSSWNSIISSYASIGRLSDSWDLFHKMESSEVKPDIVTWNCLLSGHSVHGSYKEALNILRKMLELGFKPNSSSICSILQAVVELGLLSSGKEIHGYVIRYGLDYDIYIRTSLLDMYVKNDCLTIAKSVFTTMKHRNIFAWNSLLSGYSFKGLFEDAEKLLNQMEKEGLKPDLVTWNSLVSGYSKWGHSNEALSVIHRIKVSGLTPNVVSWTAIIAGCSQNENYKDSLSFFTQMLEEGVRPNSATICSLLQACAGLSLLKTGVEIHCFCVRHGFFEDVHVKTALIDMYNKSGNLTKAHEVFMRIQNRTLASWNCMIMGYAIYGVGKEAFLLFDEMRIADIKPDAITFTALLSACKNSGFIDEGWKYFDDMSQSYNIIPTIEHYSCLIDLLGRSGFLDEAWDLIQTMPLNPDASIWGALLRSSRIHENIEFAEIAAKSLFELEPYNSANYVILMNLYAALNRWEDVENLKDLMCVRGVKTRQVWSWIQIDHTIHFFSAGKNPHPDAGDIYFELYQLVSEIKKLGYVPNINCLLNNIEQVEKEKVLLSHTEKLAITYGLLKTKDREPIRVIKNTRICSDCHSAAKYISMSRNRDVFLKDGVRFHHFREGKCSCNDCW